MKKKILVILGTRPEAIKMTSVIEALRARESLRCVLCATGQHEELMEGAWWDGQPLPEYRRSVMRKGQSLTSLTERILSEVDEVLLKERPDLVLVQGDTTTAFASALAAFYREIPVGHVEAGLRTGLIRSPFPEEWNRRGIGLLADLHFAPTKRAKENLLREGVPAERITVTGNTGIDVLKRRIQKDFFHPLLEWSGSGRLLLLTCHRRENEGAVMERILRGIRRAIEEFPEDRVLFPVHPRQGLRDMAEEQLGDCPQIRLVDPLSPVVFQNLMARSYLVLTDSGGIQEEAPFLQKPVLVLRRETERIEGLETGVARLIGTTEDSVYRGVRELLENHGLYDAMRRGKNPYGDGKAGERIADLLEEFWEEDGVLSKKA